MIARRRFVAVVTAIGLVVAGCVSDPYPLLGAGASMANPTAVGEPVRGVILYLDLREGDRMQLIGAEPIGSVEGATIRFWLSRPIKKDGVGLLIGEALEPLEGAIAVGTDDGPSDTVGIVGELTPQREGTFTVDLVRLRFVMGGAGEQAREGITTTWLVCAATPAPPDCDDEDP